MSTTFRHAGAGSGKTYSIEQDIGARLERGDLAPERLIAVTFTNRAADELRERIGTGLLTRGRPDLAARLGGARIGTVNAVCGQLVLECSFDLGLSPAQRVVEEGDQQALLNEALDLSLQSDETARLNAIGRRLGIADWQAEVLGLVEKARANDFANSDLGGFADASVSALLDLLPEPDDSLNEAGLRSVLAEVLSDVQQLVKPTKGLQASIDKVSGWLRHSELAWEDWVRVTKLQAGVKELALIDPAVVYGARVLSCPGFRGDLEDMIRGLFDAAARVMQTFAQLKVERGLVDFVDQEHLLLRALERPAVSDRLRAGLEMLVVDEFQDTSPIQLALFARLAELAEDVLLVGDAKQAIYGFRGSDPRLALDVIRCIGQAGGTLENLDGNWRSRPELVHLANDLFTQPFAHLLAEEQVRLIPRVDSQLTHEPLHWWCLEGRNQGVRAAALAAGLQELLGGGEPVLDRTTQALRPVRGSDIAVLCRSNDAAARFAEACAGIGVPTALERSGLLETPEVTLALACLRRLADPGDSLASAEILSLERGQCAGDWLGDRLDAVDAGNGREWSDTASPMLQRLAAARVEIGRLSPDEALTTAMQVSDLHRVVIAWGESERLVEHRLANLARLGELALEYEDHCRSQRLAGTVSGLILWLRALEQRDADRQASHAGEAINILTYHRAKGLEWPMVVCTDLDTNIKVSLYGARVIPAEAPFQWSEPLARRALRYWPCPFPDQKGNDPLTERLRDLDIWADAEQQARNEAIQLLYVGITRARDRLILTEEPRRPVGRWLSLLDSPHFPPVAEQLVLSSGGTVGVRIEILSADILAQPRVNRTRYWLSETNPSDDEPLEYFSPASRMTSVRDPACVLDADFGSRITISGKPDMEVLGVALHHALALAMTVEDVDAGALAALLAQYQGVVLNSQEILMRAGDLRAWIASRYPGARMHCELPFNRHLKNGQFQSGRIDLALELNDGWVVIDHKSNPRPKGEWLGLSAQHSGQLAAYSTALETLTGKMVRDRFIHFSVAGGLVSVST